MKIKTYKYILFYVIVLLLSFFVYHNFSLFKSYITKFPLYSTIDHYKEKHNIILFNNNSNSVDIKDINKKKEIIYDSFLSLLKYDLTWLNLKPLDKSNIFVLNKDLNKAEQILLKKKEYNYADYYNLANINLLKSKYTFEHNLTGYIDFARKSIYYYNTSLELVPSYKKKYFILNNLNVAKKYLNYLYFYDCNKFLLQLSNLTKKIQNKLYNTNQILDMELPALKKWENDKDLKQCILEFKVDIFRNKKNISLNINFVGLILKWIYLKWKTYIDNYDVCYQDRFLLKDKYFKSLDNINSYFSSFKSKQIYLLDVFLNWTKQDIEKLCSMRSKMAWNQKKENDDIIDSYKKLNDLLPKNNKNKKEGWKKSEDKNKDKINNKWKNKKKIKKYNDKKIESIYKESKDTFKKLQDIKTKKYYKPYDYIKKIFKKFYGNEKDFLDNVKENSVGK